MKQFALGLAIGALVTFSSQHHFFQPEISISTSANTLVAAENPACENHKPELTTGNSEVESLRAELPLREQERESAPQPFNQVARKLISSTISDISAKALVSPDMEEGMLQLNVARDSQVSLIP